MKKESKNDIGISDLFTLCVRSNLGETCVKELRFHPVRKWRFDYAIPRVRIAIEVEGGIWTGGRHIHPSGFLGDIEKYNTGTLMGWRIFRTTPQDLMTKKFFELLKDAIDATPQA